MDSIGNFLTIIRNGTAVSKRVVIAPYSRVRAAIAEILKSEGFIKDFTTETLDGHQVLRVYLKYVDGESVIHEIKRVSKPGRRYYTGINGLKPVVSGLGLSILTTSKGIMSHKEAKKLNVGGEVMCSVW